MVDIENIWLGKRRVPNDIRKIQSLLFIKTRQEASPTKEHKLLQASSIQQYSSISHLSFWISSPTQYWAPPHRHPYQQPRHLHHRRC